MDEYQEYKLFNTHPYAIVDATMRDEIPTSWEQQVIAPAFLGEDTGRCPLLVDLRSLSKEEKAHQLDLLTTQTHALEETWANLLLASNKDIKQLTMHLTKRLVLKIAGEERPKQFRYFDPGTFLQLPDILGDDGMAWLLGPVDSIGVPWVGEFTQYQKPQANAYGFRLNSSHHEKLLGIGVVNRVQLSREAPNNQAAWVNRAKAIHNYIQRALQNGLSDMDSVTVFCRHAVEHHPRFDEHPHLQMIFATLANAQQEDEIDYQELTSRIEETEWENIVKELLTNNENQQTAILES